MLKRVIIAADRQDIARRRQAAMDEYNSQKSQFESEYESYKSQRRMFIDSMENAVRDSLGNYANDLNIQIDESYGENNWSVTINNGDNPFKEGQALTWVVKVRLGENGEIIFETSSWSGLKATTIDEIEDLRRTVDILDKIQHIDWKFIVDRIGPKYGDYVKTRQPLDPSKQFDLEEAYAILNESIDERVLFQTSRNNTKRGYYKIINETPKNFTARFVSNYDYRSGQIEKVIRYGTNIRIPKDTIQNFIAIPVVEMKY